MSNQVKQLFQRVVRRNKVIQPSEAAQRLLKLFPNHVDAKSSVLDLGCTDASLYSFLGKSYQRAAGLIQVDLNDPMDKLVVKGMTDELKLWNVECQPMPTLYTLPPFMSEFNLVVTEDMLSYSPEDPQSILKGVYNSLVPGGTFVGEIGADGNLETLRMACYDVLRLNGIDASLHDPYFFPTEKEMKSMLEEEGFDVNIQNVQVKQLFPVMDDRVEFALVDYMHHGIGQKFLSALPTKELQRSLVSEVIRLCYNSMYRGVEWSHQSLRLQFIATKVAK